MSRFEIDPDIEQVLEFMQNNLKGCKLVAVAHAVAQLSDLLWARHQNPIDDTARLRPFAFLTGGGDFKQSLETGSVLRSPSANAHDPQGLRSSKIQRHALHK
jgi:hypothetical protein